MKHVAIALALSVWGLGVAQANDDADSPVRYHHTGMTVIMHSSMKPLTLLVGEIVLDSPKAFTCKSVAGCVVIMSASVHETPDVNGTATCSYVDGSEGAPGCTLDPGNGVFTVRQQSRVKQGAHVVQTKVQSFNPQGQIVGWAVDYTIYERKVKGAD